MGSVSVCPHLFSLTGNLSKITNISDKPSSFLILFSGTWFLSYSETGGGDSYEPLIGQNKYLCIHTCINMLPAPYIPQSKMKKVRTPIRCEKKVHLFSTFGPHAEVWLSCHLKGYLSLIVDKLFFVIVGLGRYCHIDI